MFVTKRKLEQALVCPSCQTNFDDPRVLPCGHTVCQTCIENNKREQELFVCPECCKRVNVPSDGFPVNQTVLIIAQIKGDYVIQPAKSKVLREKLGSLKDNLQKIKDGLANHVDKIEISSSKLINKIDIETETRIEMLQQLRDKLKKEVLENERKCIAICSENSSNNRVKQFLSQVDQFWVDSNEYLAHTELDEQKLEQLVAKSAEYSGYLLDLDASLSNNIDIVFQKSSTELQQDILAEVKCKNHHFGLALFGQDNFVHKTLIRDGIKNIESMTCWTSADTAEVCFYAVCLNKSDGYELVRIDDCGKICKRKLICDHSDFYDFDIRAVGSHIYLLFNWSLSDDEIEVCGKTLRAEGDDDSAVLVKLNDEFEPLKAVQLPENGYFAVNSSSVFFKNRDEFIQFDQDLETRDNLNIKSDKILVSETKLFLLRWSSKSSILDLESKIETQSKGILDNCTYLKVIGSDYLFLYDQYSGKFGFHVQDQDFTLVKEGELDLEDEWTLANDSTGFVCFYSKASFSYMKAGRFSLTEESSA